MKLRNLLIAGSMCLPAIAGAADAALAASPSPSELSASAITTRVYTLRFRTSNLDGAGTDGAVWVRFFGRQGRWTNYTPSLDNADDNFERGKTDFFYPRLLDVGEPHRYVEVCFNDRGGAHAEWHPNYLEVNGVRFSLNTWFYRNGEQTQCRMFSR